ncbi:hypothetical protein E3N88_00777 [Mikania micrantha]|uniref:Uncharacterized protein n=1 Tax=Mikania micrantha TaxID=192012 RepID=A0A5N6Q100_9ASTR|nr:hypothetical protein E3N88_00777 [Mikania micrantha]
MAQNTTTNATDDVKPTILDDFIDRECARRPSLSPVTTVAVVLPIRPAYQVVTAVSEGRSPPLMIWVPAMDEDVAARTGNKGQEMTKK